MTIPYAPSELQAPVPGAPLNRVQAPTVDSRGVQRAAGELAQAGQRREIPTGPFMAPGAGLQQIGEGVSAVGGLFDRVALMKAEVRNDMHVAEGQNLLAMKVAEFEKVKQTTPVDQWEEKWAAMSGAAVQSVMSSDKLSPVARERLDLYGKRWAGDAAVVVARDSTRRMGEIVEGQGIVGVMEASDAGNPGLARERLGILASQPSTDPQTVYRLGQEIDVGVERQKRAAIQATARTAPDPTAMAEEWRTNPPKGMSEANVAYGRNLMQQEGRERAVAQVDLTRDEIAKGQEGQLATEFDVDKWAEKNGLGPAETESTRAAVQRRDSDRHKAYVAANAPEMASALDTEISGFNPQDANARTDYFELRQRIGDLPDDVASPLRTKLDAIMKGDAVPADNTLQGAGRKATQSMFDQGLFGKWWTEETVMKLDEDGNETDKPVKDRNGHVKVKKVVNEAAWRAAVFQRSKLDGDYTRFLQATPNAKPAEAEAFLNGSRPRSMMAGMWDSITGQNLPPTDELYRPKGKRGGAPKAAVVDEPALVPAEPVATSLGGTALFPDDLQTRGEDGNILLALPADAGEEDIPEERPKKKRKRY